MGFYIGLMLGGIVILIVMAAINAASDYCPCEYKCCEKEDKRD